MVETQPHNTARSAKKGRVFIYVRGTTKYTRSLGQSVCASKFVQEPVVEVACVVVNVGVRRELALSLREWDVLRCQPIKTKY